MSGNTNIDLKILYYLAKVSGFAPFALKNNRLICNSLIDKVLPIIYVLLCLILLGIDVTNYLELGKIRNVYFTFDKTSTYFLGLVVDYIGTATCLIIFIRNTVRIVDIIELFRKLDGMFEKLSIVQDYKKVFRVYEKFVLASSIFLITYSITSSLLTLKYFYFIDVKNFSLIIFAELIGKLIKHHLIVIFVIVMLLIAERLRMMNECLKKISLIVRKTEIIPEQVIRDVNRRLTNFPSIDLNILKKINEFGKLYDIIRDTVENILKLFSLPLLLIIVNVLWRILTVVYFEVRNLVEDLNFKSLPNLLFRIMDIALLVFDLSAIAFVCDKIQSLVSIYYRFLPIIYTSISLRIKSFLPLII